MATGRNCSRFSLIELRVSAAADSFVFTSAAFSLVFCSTPISSTSSSRLPSLLVSRSSSSASSCSSALVLLFTSSSTCDSCSSSARCSRRITWPSSCSSSPFIVTVKSISVVLACSSGLKCGLGSRVMKYSMKSGLKSTCLSPTFTSMLRPRMVICFSSTGSSSGSSSSCTPSTIIALPSCRLNSSWSFSLELFSCVTSHIGSRSASRDLIHLIACPCGSTSSGYRLLRVTRMPFCTLSGSVGNPSIVQSPITPASTMNSVTARSRVTGTPRSSRSRVNLDRTRCSRYSWLNGPQ